VFFHSFPPGWSPHVCSGRFVICPPFQAPTGALRRLFSGLFIPALRPRQAFFRERVPQGRDLLTFEVVSFVIESFLPPVLNQIDLIGTVLKFPSRRARLVSVATCFSELSFRPLMNNRFFSAPSTPAFCSQTSGTTFFFPP